MKEKISYDTRSGVVSIEIDENLLRRLPEEISLNPSEVAIISDDRVATLFGQDLYQQFLTIFPRSFLFTFPSGEIYKTRHSKEEIENQLFEKGIGKKGLIVALGGGVVTDMAGFIAATYCRGIPYISVPTTLLGMVDASIGGKTGVDLPYGKNLVGAIYQPKKIIIDISTLRSLPAREFSCGIVEAIKHALIASKTYFVFIENHVEALLRRESTALQTLIYESCKIKSEIVTEDEMEVGKRKCLNFGHTMAHALEMGTGYRLSHGEAVAIGLLTEMFIAVEHGILEKKLLSRVEQLLREFKLPLEFHYSTSVEEFHKACLKALMADKKSFQRKARFVMINDIASPLSFEGEYCTVINDEDCVKALQWMCERFGKEFL